MSALENRVPPLLVAGLIAVLMGLSGTKLPGFELAWTARPLTKKVGVVPLPALALFAFILIAILLIIIRRRTTP